MKVTIKDIARLADVSIATVSKILNNKDHDIGEATRQKVLAIMEEKNYTPNAIARGLVTNKTNTLALIIPDITNPFFPEIARGMEDAASSNGYNVVLCNTDGKIEKEEEYIKLLISKRVDGIVFTASSFANFQHLQMLDKADIPYVLVDRWIEGMEDAPRVTVDNDEGGYIATKHLIENQYKKIAMISGPLSTTTAKSRYIGYTRAIKDSGRRIDSALIKEGSYKVESGYELANQLIDEGIDSIFAANDLIALGAIKAIKDRGLKVPEDIAVVGFDNIYIAQFTEPPLTTVHQPTYEMGSKACNILLDIMQKKDAIEKRIVIYPTLVVRETTAKRGE